MKPINPKKRWLAESSQAYEPPAAVAAAANIDDDIAEQDGSDGDERVSDVSQGVGRLTIDLEQAAHSQQRHLAAAAPETPPPLPPGRPPTGPLQPPSHPPPCGRSSHLDLGRLQPGQNAHITSETLISRVVSVVPVSEPSSSAGSSPFR